MPITINDDKLAIFKIISEDEYIRSLGFIPERIHRVKYSFDLMTTEEKQIFIFNMTPEQTASKITHNLIYQIDVNVPFADYNAADLAGEQICALLNGTDLGNTHTAYLTAAPMVLTSPANYYCIGIRFSVSETIFNKVKKTQI